MGNPITPAKAAFITQFRSPIPMGSLFGPFTSSPLIRRTKVGDKPNGSGVLEGNDLLKEKMVQLELSKEPGDETTLVNDSGPELTIQPQPENTLQIDPDGDTFLEFIWDEGKCRDWPPRLDASQYSGMPTDDTDSKFLKVNSKILCAASKYFDRAIGANSPWTPALTSDGRKLSLMDDDDHLGLFCLIMACLHFQHVIIPKSLPWSTLVGVCKVAHKYDLLSALNPWICQWAYPYRSSLRDTQYHEWIFVSFTLQWPEEFAESTRHAIVHFTRQEMQELEYGGLPQGVFEQIRLEYAKILNKILGNCHAWENHLLEKGFCGQDNCRQSRIGQFITRLHDIGMHPLPSVISGKMTKSLATYVKYLTTPKVQPYVEYVKEGLFAQSLTPNKKAGRREVIHAACNTSDSFVQSLFDILNGINGLDIHKWFPKETTTTKWIRNSQP